MSIDDFQEEFNNLYVCRVFDPKQWAMNKNVLNGEWAGLTSQGMPSKKNPSCALQMNPQYAITVSKKCTAFISLTQNECVNMFTGKQPILFIV